MFQYLEGWSTVSIPILSAWSAPIPLAHASFISLAYTTIHLRTLRLACAHRPTFSSWKIVCTFGVFRDFEEEEESLSVQSDHHVEVREREDRVAVLPRYVSLVPLHSLRERGRDLGAGLEAGDFLVFHGGERGVLNNLRFQLQRFFGLSVDIDTAIRSKTHHHTNNHNTPSENKKQHQAPHHRQCQVMDWRVGTQKVHIFLALTNIQMKLLKTICRGAQCSCPWKFTLPSRIWRSKIRRLCCSFLAAFSARRSWRSAS